MIATLEFDLTDIDGKMDHLRCVKATDLALALWEIQYRLSDNCWEIISKRKYNKNQIMEVVMDQIQDILEKHSINFDELIR